MTAMQNDKVLNNLENLEDEIDIPYLIQSIWKGKKIVLTLTIIFSILSVSYSLYLLYINLQHF